VAYTYDQWRYVFTNTFDEADARAAYDRYHVPASGGILWDSVLANFIPGPQDIAVDYHNDARAPLLFISGSEDHLMPPAVQRSNAEHYKSHTITEIKDFPGRSHLMPAQRGWEEIADYALAWAEEHATRQPRVPNPRSRSATMKIVVIGGSGLIGSKLVDLLRARGHEVVAASPDTGVNTLTGDGLQGALAGARVVVDVANSPSFEDKAVMDFFVTSGRNLLAAEAAAGVKHHVALSIVGTQRITESGYLRAKAAQENLIKTSGIAYTILESTQFFEFIERIAKDALDGDVYRLSPALMQPVVSDDVVQTLADIAVGEPRNATVEVAGPDAIPLNELARQVLAARRDSRQIVADTHARYYGAELNDQSLIPGPEAHIGSTRFSDWVRQSIRAA
jgi:uncharacterized protein YbjT (DUF2867 family)